MSNTSDTSAVMGVGLANGSEGSGWWKLQPILLDLELRCSSCSFLLPYLSGIHCTEHFYRPSPKDVFACSSALVQSTFWKYL